MHLAKILGKVSEINPIKISEMKSEIKELKREIISLKVNVNNLEEGECKSLI